MGASSWRRGCEYCLGDHLGPGLSSISIAVSPLQTGARCLFYVIFRVSTEYAIQTSSAGVQLAFPVIFAKPKHSKAWWLGQATGLWRARRATPGLGALLISLSRVIALQNRMRLTQLRHRAQCCAFHRSGCVKPLRFAHTIAVETPITECPPHRSVRAQFRHTAPTLGV